MNSNSPELLCLVPDVRHKSGAGAQAHAVMRQPPVSMVSRDYCSRGLRVRRQLVPEGERCCVDTIAAKSRLGIAPAGRQAASPRQSVWPHSDSGDPPSPFGARCCADGGGSPEGWNGICLPCPAQGCCLLSQRGAQHSARCRGRVAQGHGAQGWGQRTWFPQPVGRLRWHQPG